MSLKQLTVAAGLALCLVSGTAKAAYIINIDQVGADVVASGSGTLDFRDLTFGGFQFPSKPGVSGSSVELGNSANFADFYGPITGPASFGTGSFTGASAATGYIVGVDAAAGELIIPGGIQMTGFDLGLSTATFSGTTIAALGLESGSYTYSWGTTNADTLTLNIADVSSVPLPASAPLFGAALLALAGLGYGMKRKTAAA